jgi:hypothetical protein
LRIATITLLALFVLTTGALADDKWPSDYVPGTPNPQAMVGGDDIATAFAIGALPFSDTGDTTTFVDDYDEECPYSGSTSPDVVYQYTPSGDGLIDITLCNAVDTYDTKLYIYEDVHTPGTPFACNDDACPGYVSELLQVQLNIGHTYFIVVDGYGGDCGEYLIDITGDQGGVPVEARTWGEVKNVYR